MCVCVDQDEKGGGLGRGGLHTCEALAIDRLAARAVEAREVAALEHELCTHTANRQYQLLHDNRTAGRKEKKKFTHVRDDAVEDAALVSEPMLARRELAEVARSLGHDVVVEFEH